MTRFRNIRSISILGLAAAALLIVPTSRSFAGNGEQRLEARLVPTGVDPDAKGKAVLRDKGSKTRFKVEAERLAAGPVDLLVGGNVVGSFTISALGRGEIDFRNPQGDNPGVLPLTFDPRGQKVDVRQAGQIVLSVVIGTTPGGNGNGNGNGNGSGNVDEIRAGLIASDAFAGADGKARFRIKSGKSRFNVEIEDVPVGSYALRVDGVEVATITAQTVPGTSHVEGEVEFAQPSEPGKLPLTFDPRGKLIEVLAGDVVALQQVFPTQP